MALGILASYPDARLFSTHFISKKGDRKSGHKVVTQGSRTAQGQDYVFKWLKDMIAKKE